MRMMMISLSEEELAKALDEISEMIKQYTDTQPISTSEEEDIQYVRKNIMESLKIPKEYLKCECGAEKCNTTHSDWCPKYRK